MKKQFLMIIALILSFSACSFSNQKTTETSPQTKTTEETTESSGLLIVERDHEPIMVTVKYRENPIDIALFEALDTTGSSFVQGAWYDKHNEYMIINLSGTNYQYCNLPADIWENFKQASSFGSFYNKNIKGSYACE